MIIVVEGTKSFKDYDIFMRAMSVGLSNIKSGDDDIQIWSLGPHAINGYTAAFCNSSENYLRQKGFKISFSRVNYSWVTENMQYVDYYAFFSSPNEKLSKLAEVAQLQEGLELAIFRY